MQISVSVQFYLCGKILKLQMSKWLKTSRNHQLWHKSAYTYGLLSLSARVLECQKIEKGGFDQYGPERLIFATIKKCGTKALIS